MKGNHLSALVFPLSFAAAACTGGADTRGVAPPEGADVAPVPAACACGEDLPAPPAGPALGGSGATMSVLCDCAREATPPRQEEPLCSAEVRGKIYVGFGGRQLGLDRVEERSGTDRHRLKPYSALAAEYARVLGATPPLLATLGPTFGLPPDRWYIEPSASAVSIYSAYRAAFQGCLGLMATGSSYASHPSAASAQETCGRLARQFWSRTPDVAEVEACVHATTDATAKEMGPRRRWAYGCASILTSAGFLTY